MITPRYELNGFTPKFSYPLLATGGPDGTRVYRMDTGSLASFTPSWFAGWWDGSVVMGLNDVPGGQRRTLIAGMTGDTLPQNDDPATVVGAVAGSGYWASNVGGVVRINGAVVDTNPRNLGIAANGAWVCHQRNVGPLDGPEWSWWQTVIYHQGQLQRRVTPQVPSHSTYLCKDGAFCYGDTSRSFLDETNGYVLELTDTDPPSEFCPVVVYDNDSVRWAWSVVGGEARHILVRPVYGHTTGYLLELPWGASSIDVVWRPEGWWLAWGNSQGRVGVAVLTLTNPIPLPMAWPPTDVPEPPIEPPVEPPMPTTPNHLPTVQTLRATYTTPLGIENAYQISNDTAWKHRDEGFGLRRKTSGNNYNGYAVDIVFHKPTNMLVDILGDSEGAGNPQWTEVGAGNPDEWAAPTDPAPVTPPPIDPPVDPPATDLETRVLALEEDLMRLREALTSWIIK